VLDPTQYTNPILKSIAHSSSGAPFVCIVLFHSTLDGLIGEDGLSEAARGGAILGANIDMVDASVEPAIARSIIESNF
jgi:hypothetical protein